MNRDDPPGPALLEWLVRIDAAPRPGWEPQPAREELRCDPQLVARLAEVARPLGTTRRFVAGCPVIQHPRGRPIAAAAGAAWLVARSGMAAGALATAGTRQHGLDDLWVELQPWGTDIAFARVIDLLRAHLTRAYELAESEPASESAS